MNISRMIFPKELSSGSLELTPLDERGVAKFPSADWQDLGEFRLIGSVSDGLIRIPDDGLLSVAFPTEVGEIRYVGPMRRAVCMFFAHKSWRVLPATPDLARMIEEFDRHDSFEISWAVKAFGVEAVVGPDGLKFLEELAIEQGILPRRGGSA